MTVTSYWSHYSTVMNALPRLICGRELGFRRGAGSFVDDKKYMSKLMCLETDVARVAENDENLFDLIPIYDVKFCPGHFHPNFVAVTDELGFVAIVDIKADLEGEDKILLKERCHENALFNVDWSPHTDGVLATCSGDRTVRLWDIKKDFACTATLTGHGRSVKSVRFHPNNPNSVLSGGRDGGIRLWDVRVGGSSVNIIPLAHGKNKDEPVSVTDVLFQDEHTVISCGSKDGAIKLWDLRKTYCGLKKIQPVSKFEWKDRSIAGFHSMCIDSSNNLYASTFHEVLKFNLSSELGQTDPAHFVAPDVFNSYMKIGTSHDGRFLISGSSLPETYVWDTWSSCFEPTLVLKCCSEGTKVSACVAAFSPQDNLTIVSGNDEGQIQIWRPYFDQEQESQASVESAKAKKFVASSRAASQSELERISTHVDRCQLISIGANRREANNAKLRANGCHIVPKTMTRNAPVSSDGHKSNEFNLQSLLRDLPNFVMDGTHPSLQDVTVKSANRRSCWLDDMKLSVNNNPSLANFQTSQATKRPAAAMLASRDLNTQTAPQPKKLKLKLKAQNKTPRRALRTPGQSPRVRARTPTTPAGRRPRRVSVDTGTLKSPVSSQNITKYFSTVQRTLARQLSPEPS